MAGSVKAGSNWAYYLSVAGAPRQNYYTKATELGEPAGIWQGAGAEDLGLSGEVTPKAMEAVYGHFIDPRTVDLEDAETWADGSRLGGKPYQYKSREDLLAEALRREPEATPERVEELRTEIGRKKISEARHFIDYTFSPQKSISVLHAAVAAQEHAALSAGRNDEAMMWAAKREAIEAAVWAGNNAALAHLAEHAGFTRVGHHGQTATGETVGRRADAHRFVVASFFQHTARPVPGRGEAPQLHIHNPILNRVQGPDGKWRTIDGKAIFRERGAASAIAETVTEEQLTRTLGLEWRMREDGKAREIVGVSEEARELFSPRRAAITEKVGVYVEAFKAKYGREPNTLELSRLSSRATLTTRGKKTPDASTAAERVARWSAELRDHTDTTLEQTAHDSLGRIPDARAAAEAFNPEAVISQALGAVQQKKSAWTRSDLIVELRRAMPDHLGGLREDTITAALHELADRATSPRTGTATDPREEVYRLTAPELIAAPPELRRDSGQSMYTVHGGAQYATAGQLSAEERIENAARSFGAPRLDDRAARRVLKEIDAKLAHEGHSLGDDQADAIAGILTSGRKADVLIGPAGTGKSYTVGALTDAWEREIGGRAFGLALAQRAADVLREEGLTRTENVARWLRVQREIEEGTAKAADAVRWGLRSGDLLVVDEAGMADNASLARVQEYAERVGAKVLITGDPQQLSAVGSGGALRLAHQVGAAYELDEVRRFNSRWERKASLKLREGDTKVLATYDAHGRIRDAGTLEDAYEAVTDAYVADTLAGRQSIIVVGSNATAADISAEVRARLVALGFVEENGVPIGDGAESNLAGAGDLIQARENDRRVKDAHGNWVVNRRNYQVQAITDDGGMKVRPVTGHRDGAPVLGPALTLPAAYVQSHVSLAYASTAHAAQGATVDRAYTIATEGTGPDALYVAMTRGRESNVAYVVTEGGGVERDENAERPEARDVLAAVVGREAPDVSATETLRTQLAEAASMRTLGAIWTDVQRQLTEAENREILASLLPEHIEELDRDEATASLYRLMGAAEVAGMDKRGTVASAIAQRALRDPDDEAARSIAQVLHWRITNRLTAIEKENEGAPVMEPTGDTYAEWTKDGSSPVHEFGREYAAAADARATALGAQAADAPPAWAAKFLGEAPGDDPLARMEWETRAGRVESYRELYGIADTADPIGPAPALHHPEKRAAWYAAWRALGRPEIAADEAALTPGVLRQRTADYERAEAWAPESVSAELRAASQTAYDAATAATLAEAAAERVPGDAALAQAAAEARVEADAAERVRADLAEIAETRAEWYLDTAEKRTAAERARAELRRRSLEAPANATADELAQHRTLRELSDAGAITDADHQALARDEAAADFWREVDAVSEELGRDRYDVLSDIMRPGPLTVDEGDSLAEAMRERVRLGTAEAVEDAQAWRAHLGHLEADDAQRRQDAEAAAEREPRVEEVTADEPALTAEQAAEADMWAAHLERAEAEQQHEHQAAEAEVPVSRVEEAEATPEAIEAAEPWAAHLERAEVEQQQERAAEAEVPVELTPEQAADARRAEQLEKAREAAAILAQQREAAAAERAREEAERQIEDDRRRDAERDVDRDQGRTLER